MINVYIISGFLGAGKTTLIQKLLKEKHFEKVLLLENEFGEVGVDAAFFSSSLAIKEINNGCICCSLQGDFRQALEEIEAAGISDLLIEPSGVGKLSEIINVVREDPDFRIVSHLCVVDVKTCQKYHRNFRDYFDDQVKAANAVILSHLDVADEQTARAAQQLVKQLNPDAVVTTVPVGDLPIGQLLDIIVNGGDLEPEEAGGGHHHDEGEEHHHHHHHHDGGPDDDDDEDEPFHSIAFHPEHGFTVPELEAVLAALPADIIRAKGYVHGPEGTLYFNYVLNESNVFAGDTRDDTLVVVIGTTLDRAALKEAFHG
jgi:G3E family GTPase